MPPLQYIYFQLYCTRLRDIRFEIDGEYYTHEVNSQFSGGYPHTFECGVDHMKLILNNLNGLFYDNNMGNCEEGLYTMKYNKENKQEEGYYGSEIFRMIKPSRECSLWQSGRAA